MDVRYAWEGGSGQSSFAWVVGRDRGTERKLAAFSVNATTRMFDDVAGRLVHSVASLQEHDTLSA